MRASLANVVVTYTFCPIPAGSVTQPFLLGKTPVTNGIFREFLQSCQESPISAFLTLPQGEDVYLGEGPKHSRAGIVKLSSMTQDLIGKMVAQWERNLASGVREAFAVATDDCVERGTLLTGLLWLLKRDVKNESLRETLGPEAFWKALAFRKTVPAAGTWRIDRKPVLREKFGGENQPAVYVDYHTAWRASRWLVEGQVRAGLLPPGTLGRLPTDAEWEMAAGVPEGRRYATWTGALYNEDGKTKLAHFGWSKKDGTDRTIDVHDPRYPEGPHGLRHMTGNVHEWMSKNPSERRPYAFRGGAYGQSQANLLRNDVRISLHTDAKYLHLGFRVSASIGSR
jgi:formylglycine-generating enzyme required for sulfatase activity